MAEKQSSKNEKRTQGLAELANEIFIFGTRFKNLASQDDPEAVRRRINRLFSEFENRAHVEKHDSEKIMTAKFALAAFIDEVVANSSWYGKDFFQLNPLAAEYFQTFTAGDDFFQRLDELRRRAHSHSDVLEIYYLCLTLGFRGRYSLYEPEKIKYLIEEIYHDLRRDEVRSEPLLSPAWQRKDEFVTQVSVIPVWAILVGGAALAILFFFIMQAFLGNASKDAVNELAKLMK